MAFAYHCLAAIAFGCLHRQILRMYPVHYEKILSCTRIFAVCFASTLAMTVTYAAVAEVGMECYLRDDAFQSKAPKMLIWEILERDMRAPPDYEFREARYVSSHTEWLLRVSAWVQASCRPSAVTAMLAPVGLAASAANLKGGEIASGPTKDGDFIEIGFDKPIEKLDFLVARATAAGSKTITLEGSGPGVATRRFTLNAHRR